MNEAILDAILNLTVRLMALTVVALIVIMVITFIRHLLQTSAQRRLLEKGRESGGEVTAKSEEEETELKSRRSEILKEQLSNFAARKPYNATRFVRSWLFDKKDEPEPPSDELSS